MPTAHFRRVSARRSTLWSMNDYFAVSHLNQLSALEVHKLYKLRVDIFVNEQKCPYAEIDDADAKDSTFHVLNWDADKNLIGTARVYPSTHAGDDVVQLGRVCVSPAHRHKGMGEELMRQTLRLADEQFPGKNIYLEAQTPQRDFYEGFGFEVVGKEIDIEGTPHLPMLKTVS